MGAFFLLRRAGAADVRTRRAILLDELERQGFRHPRRFETPECEIHLFPELAGGEENAHADGPDSFCLSVGTFLYRGEAGAAALAGFQRDFEWPCVPWDEVCGQFCLLVRKHGRLHLVTDRVGLFKVYRNADASVVSSSFLALAAVAERRTVEPQSVYEYVFQGANFGTRTVFREVEVVDADAILTIDGSGVSSRDLPRLARGWSAAGFDDLVEVNLAALRRYFSALVRASSGRVSTALTGGYDSRLMLGLLRELGADPYVYVYGAEGDVDVRVARQIAAGEGFGLHHTDKHGGPKLDREACAAAVETNYRAFDGYPVDGIFDDGSDLRTRRERCRNGELMLNGIGGELYRRPDLPNRPHHARDVVWRFYCRFDPLECTGAFREEEYVAAVARDLVRATGVDGEVLGRADVSLAVPAFYYRFWAGRNNSVNNRIGRSLQPFCDLPIVRESIRIPVSYRSYGAFEAALIRALAPRLAAYDSSHGHDFAHDPPVEHVVREWRDTVRPPVSYRYGFLRGPPARPYWLQPDYVGAVVDPSFPYLRRFLHLERGHGALRYNRICTLEHLFQRCSAVLP
jgi:asparagine synthase (glutamine-hydrolysing)